MSKIPFAEYFLATRRKKIVFVIFGLFAVCLDVRSSTRRIPPRSNLLILTLKRFADDQAGPWPDGGAGQYTCAHPCGARQAVRDNVVLGPKGSSFSIIFC